MTNPMIGSWRTTAAGIIAIITALGSAGNLLLDNNPATNPDWNVIAVTITTAFGLLFARDNKVSSEDAGLK